MCNLNKERAQFNEFLFYNLQNFLCACNPMRENTQQQQENIKQKQGIMPNISKEKLNQQKKKHIVITTKSVEKKEIMFCNNKGGH